jgi:uncharacterized membrane protein YbhN (UPF0104 family)
VDDRKTKPQARWRGLVTGLRLALVAGSVWALRREFAGMTPAALLRRLGSYGPSHLSLGIAAVIASFVLLGGIELLALRSRDIRSAGVTGRTAFATAFVAHAFSQSIGIALLTGTAVRLRSYRRYGLGTADVAQVSAGVTLTVTLGLLAVGGWALLTQPLPLVVAGHAFAVRPVGAVLCLTVLAWLAWCIAGRNVRQGAGRWHLPRPTPPVGLAQVGLASADWLITGVVLFVFIPPSIGLGVVAFLQLCIIAQLVGVLSHVPAGAGVFEVALLALVTTARPDADRAGLLAAIVMYRAVYYILPLVGAMLLSAGSEWWQRRRGISLGGAPSLATVTHGVAAHGD